MKAISIILIGGSALLVGKYLYSLNRAGQKAIVQVSGNVRKVTLEGVEVVLKYNIKNPTNTSIEMAAPLIKLSYNNKILASSSMSLVEIPEDVRSTNGNIRILPFKETGHVTTSILLAYPSLIGTGAQLIARMKSRLDAQSEQEPIKFEIETTSTVFTKIGKYPYDEKVTITI